MAASEIPWALIAPLIVLYLILVISALVNCSKQEELNGPKWLWLLIIAGISFIGPISYFVIGKRRHM
ncbi:MULTISPECIES: PLDc N-terminal domain-containing protein [Bacillus]|uniref:Transcriptional regulator n=1 Tax=Bacillus glycinifermentans TaxID=1664069 RepID=A0AAJ4D4D4_9BACI|nr:MULTISPECIES: PLDc N-terminal domain-containing protein [Bacillus]KKB75201.1 Negative regulatory protein YxlE [Bacillus sp. TH008]MBU8786058.1 PLDc N-terminal domain-containing protein [Bacillus glycinifermentans]MDU0071648.1 PLDc N-terminal domain-containing protein [Bacillus sp. IG6]MED8020006.1 PLDc N-terminal domain-containing protein [Bacillus glycinifermentans]NUJ17577.1 transcriptional regulator [Bacillus glycinifermentans]